MQTSIKLPGIYMHPTAMTMAWIYPLSGASHKNPTANMTQLLGARLCSNRLRYFKTPSNSMQVIVSSQDLTESLTKRSTSRGPSTFDFDESNWGQRQPCRRPPRTNQLATLLVKHIKHFTTEHDATRGGARTT